MFEREHGTASKNRQGFANNEPKSHLKRLAETADAAQNVTDEPHRVTDGFNQYRMPERGGVGGGL